MSFPQYSEYKDSGVEWLGVVPAHWAVERLKLSTESCQNGIWGNDAQGDENDVICIRVADFDRNRMCASLDNPTYRNVTAAEFKSRMVSQGDLLLEKSGGGEKQPVGFVVLYEDENPAICANFIARIRLAAGMNPSFWRYVHAAGYSIGLNVPSIKQTSGIQNLDQHSYLNERAAFPPEVEQARIAAFLDHETARIDALVEQQKRLIELLKEKRQAVISHAVTKGLDPDVPMKDSGVEWLGEVPAHWDKTYFKRIAKTKYGIGEPPKYQDSGVPLIRATNVSRGAISKNSMVMVNPDDIPSSRILWLQPGDIIVVRSGAYTGDSAIIQETHLPAIAGFDMVASPVNCFPMFLQYVLLSKYFKDNQVDIEKHRAAQPHLNAEELGACFTLLPPADEQVKISAFLDHETARIDSLMQEGDSVIKLLQERRSALISAAVTGKIDVRSWQPPAGSSTPAEATKTEAV